VRLERLDLGPVTADGVLASVVGQRALDISGRIHGIIGQDVLAPRRYTIDFRSRRVAWHAGPAVGPHRGSTLMLQFEAGRFLVELPQRRSVLRLVPDSGAAGLVLFERHGHPALPISLAPGLADMATLNQRQAVRPAWVGELRVGFAILRNLPAVVVHRSGSASSEGDGLLPLHLFDRVTFSGPEGLLIVEERV
jgi:hypothetical protein